MTLETCRVKDPYKRLYFQVPASPKTIKLLIFFMISVIFLKMGKHGDFRICSFQVVDAWWILQFNRKNETYF